MSKYNNNTQNEVEVIAVRSRNETYSQFFFLPRAMSALERLGKRTYFQVRIGSQFRSVVSTLHGGVCSTILE